MTSQKINHITNQLISFQEFGKTDEAVNLYLTTVKELKKDPILGSDLEWINNLIYPETFEKLSKK